MVKVPPAVQSDKSKERTYPREHEEKPRERLKDSHSSNYEPEPEGEQQHFLPYFKV